LQFHDPTGATGYVLAQESDLAPGVSYSIPGGTAYELVTRAGHRTALNRAVLIGRVGPFVVQMTYTSTGRLDRAGDQAAFAAQTRALDG
ncbi:MAG TPA: hypothetical protein VGF84_12710, partial [Micromonosporaceae bacterium]